MLVGKVIADDTAVIASRSFDFSNQFEDTNNIELEIFSSEIVKAKELRGRINVYGTEVQIDHTFLGWNITTDLESPLVESSDTVYYLYVSHEGQPIISDKKPYFREDLKGDYHPYDSHRLVGMVYNDSSSNFTLVDDAIKGAKSVVIKDLKASGIEGGTFTAGSWQTRDLNTIEGNSGFVLLVANQFSLLSGYFSIECVGIAFAVNGHQIGLLDVTANIRHLGYSTYSGAAESTQSPSSVKAYVTVQGIKTFSLQHFCQTSQAGNGFGTTKGWGDEVYALVKVTKIR
jgi:hypothetical protein